MKIQLIAPAKGVPVLGPSGASAHLRGMAWALHRAGHELRILAASSADHRGRHGEAPVELETAAYPGWPSWLPRWRERAELWHARRVAALGLRGPPPDLMYERWSLFSDAGGQIRRRRGGCWILEVNAPLAQERARFEELRDPAWAEQMQARVLQQADQLVAVSPWVQRWLIEDLQIPSERVHWIPNGVEPPLGEPGQLRAERRRREGWEGRFVIGFLGSMKPWHGVERLREVVEAIPGSLGLAIGGGAPDLGPRVRCVGQLPEHELSSWISAMDVALVPYPADAPPWFCPLKILAYRSCGTPVVATAVGELGSLIGEGGSLVPPDELTSMVEACLSWRGRRAPVWLRSWDDVARDVLELVK